ncbi:putative bifunctional diguanylate cyclase/phosphodiesterase [Muricoccus vinaceus]|uniref:Bifunctional diguanylate cyclase/phosphodiesterase n=1 Tax=Muricoccus vinaceus TaxID=424704 RepID=A0ABV6INS8_9PROT
MIPAPMPRDERERIAALRRLDILDTAPDAVYDAFTELARSVCGTPIAALSLVDTDRQWFKSVLGLPLQQTSRDHAFCAHAIMRPDHVMVVPDALLDDRFASNPLVTGMPGIRFYAGAPLLDRDGFVLGSLCVIDREPREVDRDMVAKLAQIAAGASATLQLHGCMRELSRMALVDPLTGLANRAAFDRRLEESCAGTGSAALLMFDIDRFKGINDLFGHPGGDRALCEVARRLRAVARAGDMVARFGGDEFAILCGEGASVDAALAIAGRVHAALADTFQIDGQVVPLRTSIGVAVAPRHASGAEELVAASDAALYAAKRAGRGITRLALSPEAPAERAPVDIAGRMTLHNLLREALLTAGCNPFHLHFQPILDLPSGRVMAFEALVRWTLLDGQRVAPSDFVPVAEQSGLVPHIDRWVLMQACRAACSWPEAWAVSVNMSPATVALLDVVELVQEALAVSGLPPSRLRLEITETMQVPNPQRMSEAMQALRALGVTVALDDFGNGYASVTNLRRFPFNAVKLDRSLTAGLGTDRQALPVVRAMLDLTQALGLRAVAEGVETDGQFRLLHGLGVSRMQGFLFGHPVPEEEVVQTASEAETLLAALLRPEGAPGGLAQSVFSPGSMLRRDPGEGSAGRQGRMTPA